MTSLDRLPLNRRRLVQTSAATLALAHLPMWSAATHAAQPTPDPYLVEGNTTFALSLYRELAATAEGNLLVSPYSVSLALALAYVGAEGETADQMAKALSFALDPSDLPAAFSGTNADLLERGNAEEDPDDGTAARGLAIANALWGEQTFAFNDDYLTLLEDGFESELNLVDFIGAPDAARDEINDWVAENTNDRITDIVPPGVITEITRLVLANAIWFSGPWQTVFDPENTEDGDFTLLDGSTVTAPFMHQEESFAWVEGEGFQAIELPYEGSNFAFTILLPDDGDVATLAASLDERAFGQLLRDLETRTVDLAMPRFSFEFATGLVDALTALGIEDAFDPDLADFSGMLADDTADPLVIGDVLHKAFINLDENGTEAAAATVVVMDVAMAQEPEKPIEVRVDRPFLFAIRDTDTGTILFLGHVLDPS